VATGTDKPAFASVRVGMIGRHAFVLLGTRGRRRRPARWPPAV